MQGDALDVGCWESQRNKQLTPKRTGINKLGGIIL